MNAKLRTRNLRRTRWWVRFEVYYSGHTMRMNYRRLSARASAIWSGQCSLGCDRYFGESP